jgi:subtilisin-like proprotein convertase family protein
VCGLAEAGPVTHVALHVNDSGGDGDGYLEPGEPFSLREFVRNDPRPSFCEPFTFPGTCAPAGRRTHVVGVFAAPTSAFDLSSQSSPYPDVLENGVATGNSQPFTGRVLRTARCGRLVRSAVLLGSDQANDTVRFRIPLGARGPVIHQASADVPKAIPDGNLSSARSALTIPSSALIRDIDVRIDSIEHSAARELVLKLIPPASSTPPGASVFILAQHRGGLGANYTGTIFDAEAPRRITDGQPPFSGHFRPEAFSPYLGSLYGRDQRGTWTLSVLDSNPGNAGTIRAWGLDIRHSVCSVAPRARFTVARAMSGKAIAFDASGTVGAIARFDWDLDGDGVYERVARQTVRHTYSRPRAVTVGLRVTDTAGNQSFFRRAVEIGRAP